MVKSLLTACLVVTCCGANLSYASTETDLLESSTEQQSPVPNKSNLEKIKEISRLIAPHNSDPPSFKISKETEELANEIETRIKLQKEYEERVREIRIAQAKQIAEWTREYYTQCFYDFPDQ